VTASTDRVAAAALGSIRMPDNDTMAPITKVGYYQKDSGASDVAVWVDLGDGEVRMLPDQNMADRIIAAVAGNTTSALIGRVALITRFNNGFPVVTGLLGTAN
jgi:hypothetical protein